MPNSGSLLPDSRGFTVALKSPSAYTFDLNTEVAVNLSTRQRFTLAHELAHTLFYEERDGFQREDGHAPKGPKLEALCQFAAGNLVVPRPLLEREIRSGPRLSSTTQLRRLSKTFAVSAEVILRRIESDSLVDVDTALVCVDIRGDEKTPKILAFCYHPSLQQWLPQPRLYKNISEWLSRWPSVEATVPGRYWCPLSSSSGLEFTVEKLRPRSGATIIVARFVLL
jgi:hypothetical protein